MDKRVDFALATKARKLARYFQQHGRIHVVLDATREDVCLPAHLKNNPALNLVLNVRMPQAITLDASGLHSRFSFSGQPFDCHVPMDAIWAAYVPGQSMDEGLIWEDSVPALVRSALAAFTDDDTTDEEAESDAEAEDEERARKKEAAKASRGSHLRVVK